jgi:predicted acetyltransferase
MSKTIVRLLQDEEITSVVYDLVSSYAFEPSPPLPVRAERAAILRDRQEETFVALFDDGVPLSCAAAAPMTQQVRGTIYSMGGVWGVATDPTARRRGYSRQVIGQLLATLHESGIPLSCLHPFRERFYERLGYVTFPLPMRASFLCSALLPLLDTQMPGTVERMLVGEGISTFRRYLQRLQRKVHGMALFGQDGRDRMEENRYWMALARVDGQVVGVILYKLEGEHAAGFTLRAYHFSYLSSAGRTLLLDWIARHDGQASHTVIHLPRHERPEIWHSGLRVKLESEVRAPMGRIVDVTGIDGMHCGPGSFTARTSDELCPWNEGTWRFETVDGVLQIRPARVADCNLSIQGLSALIYGTHDPADLVARGWGDPSPLVQEQMQNLFPPLLPHLYQFF